MQNPRVKIILENGKEINLELYPDKAPITVKNFINLVNEKFYDGVCFHRIIPNFMIQTGGYYVNENTINEKPETPAIKGEFANNGCPENNIKHELGVISMARTNEMNSASSQIFICSTNTPHLDGSYAAFGKTIDQASNDVVLELSHVPTVFVSQEMANFPYPIVNIKTIRMM